MLHIIKAKEQCWFVRGTESEEARTGVKDEKNKGFKITIGTYLEFDDGWVIQGPDGRIHKGTGTVVRFNYRHQTWSVQQPQRCKADLMGHVFTSCFEPCWLKPERESGFTTAKFKREFSGSFVELCMQAHDRIVAMKRFTLCAST